MVLHFRFAVAMRAMRLAFAVAVHVDPDILLIDEVLAVGDQDLQGTCFGRILVVKKER